MDWMLINLLQAIRFNFLDSSSPTVSSLLRIDKARNKIKPNQFHSIQCWENIVDDVDGVLVNVYDIAHFRASLELFMKVVM